MYDQRIVRQFARFAVIENTYEKHFDGELIPVDKVSEKPAGWACRLHFCLPVATGFRLTRSWRKIGFLHSVNATGVLEKASVWLKRCF